MTKQYLPRALFEGMTCSAAQLHVLGKASIDQMAQTYWDSYKNTYIDDDVVQDIIRAANDGINLLTRAGATQLDSFFHHLKWYCTCFGQDGRYIRRGFFDGTFFQKSESQDIDRVTHFLDKLKRYYVGLTAGLRWYPPAPDGWSLQTRKMWNSEVKW